MAKFKISYKLLSESTEELNGVSSEILECADALKKIGGKLTGDESLRSIQKNIQDGAGALEEFTQGLKGISAVMATLVDMYTATENNNSKKVDNARAHNRDFYKNPVSVPSASVGSSGGGSSPVTVNAAIQNNTVNITNVGATPGNSPSIRRVNDSFAAPAAAAPAAASARVPAAHTTSASAAPIVSGTSGASGAAVGAAVAGGVAAAGGIAAAVVHGVKKKNAQEADEITPAMKELAESEKKLEEALARAKSPLAESD